jgi:beta-xylosidase
MSSTTMHMSPGVPIMKSNDLVNWSIVSYAYDTLVDSDLMNLKNGKSTYGRGSWASSLRYHKGIYYVSTFAQTTGRTHIYSTKDIEKGPWKSISFSPSLHDHSLFFDDDEKVYMIYGNKKLTLVELKGDLTGIKEDGLKKVIIEDATLPTQHIGQSSLGEGSQLFKINGTYYLLNITWPKGGMRTVVIHKAEKITGPYEGRIALQDKGVAQGGLIDMPDGRWFAYLFRDYGAVGRIPYLVPVLWQDGWPVLGENGKVPEQINLPPNKSIVPGIVSNDDFNRRKDEMSFPLVWQWNHNPDHSLWSLKERKGFLRLKTGRIDSSVLFARNMLTQRTFGPTSSGTTLIDVSNMKEGDYAGICLLQSNYGIAGIQMQEGKKYIVMENGTKEKRGIIEKIPLKQNSIYLKASCDFTEKKDEASFYYSLDGKNWKVLGNILKMKYTLDHFMGYRFGLFTIATKTTGGFVDFDFFHVGTK